jgi:hypothetical protein
VTRPIILRTPKRRRYWLVLEGNRYRPIAPRILCLRLRELGLAHHCERLGRSLRPAEIADRIGAVVTPSIFAAAELAHCPKCKRPSCTRARAPGETHCCEGCMLDVGHDPQRCTGGAQ